MTNNYIKKYLSFLVPFFLILFMSGPVFSAQSLAQQEEDLQNIEEVECGVVMQDGTEVVAPRSFSLCKEDITYNAFYYMFGEIFNDNDILKRMLFKNDRDVFNNVAAEASGISGPVMTVISAVTYLVFIIASIILSYVTIKYLYRTATTGEFGGNWHSVWVPLRSLIAIMLIAPIGGVSIVQIIVMVAALIGAGLGNYLWGSFLNKFQMDAFVQGAESEKNRSLSYSQANSMVESQLCMDRTKKAVRKSSFFNKDDRGIAFIDPYDINDHVRMLTECTDESLFYGKYGHSILEGSVHQIEFQNTSKCSKYNELLTSTIGLSGYDSKVYGESYNCGFLRFNNPEPITELTDDGAIEMATDSNVLSDQISFGYDTENMELLFYYRDDLRNEFSSKLQPLVQNVVSAVDHKSIMSNLNAFAKDKITQGVELNYSDPSVMTAIGSLKSTMIANASEVYQEIDLLTNQSSAVKGIYVAYTIIQNNLLGSKFEILGNENLEQNVKYEVPFYYQNNDYIYKDFQEYTRKSSKALQAIHCLRLFPENFNELESNKDLNIAISDDLTYEGWMNYISSYPNVNFECSEFYFLGDDPKSEKARITSTLESTGDSDLISMVNDFDSTNQSDVEILKNHIKEKGLSLLKEAEAEKETLSLWFYVVRQATEQAYAEVLKESIDTSVPINMRKQGFPTAGGYMLTIALNQVNASSLLSSMRDSVQWGSNVDDESALYYKPSFNSTIDGQLPIEEINKNGIKFSPMKIAGFFSSGNLSPSEITSINESEGTDGMTEQEGLDKFLKGVENYIFGPVKHLKRAAGIPEEITLRDGIEECYNKGNCATGNVHPMNALIFFGNELLEVSVMMIVITFIVDKVATMLDAGTGGSGSMGNGGIKSMLVSFTSKIPFVKGLTVALSIIAMILKIFYPLWGALFIAGIFLSYILPTIPFIAFLLVYIGWIILALELIIAAPIWLLLLAVPDQNGAGRASGMEVWNFFGLLIMKPAFMVIALAFAWFLASVSVFIVNSTIFSVFAPASESASGIIMSIINFVLFYVIYVIIIIIAMLQAFKLISILPDQMSKWINVRQSNDAGVVDSVGSDHMLQAILVQQGVGTAQRGSGSFNNEIDEKFRRKRSAAEHADLRGRLNDIHNDDERHEDMKTVKENQSDPTKDALEKDREESYSNKSDSGSPIGGDTNTTDEVRKIEEPTEKSNEDSFSGKSESGGGSDRSSDVKDFGDNEGPTENDDDK